MPIWKEAEFQRPNTYNIANNEDGTKTITQSFGDQLNDACPLSPEQLNKLEERTFQYCGVSTGTSSQYVIKLTDTSKPTDGTAYKFIAHTGNAADAKVKIIGLDGENYTYPIFCNGKWIGSDVIKADTMVCFGYHNGKIHLINGADNKRVGDIVYSATPLTDAKYLPCDGRSLDKTEYQKLFNKIGYDYGMDLEFIDTTTNTYSSWATDGNKIIGMNSNALYSSVDGINYSKITTQGTIEGTYKKIYCERGLWFLVTSYTSSSIYYYRLYTSLNGIIWEKILDGAREGNYKVSSNSYGWIVLEHWYSSRNYCRAYYSTNKTTWTSISNQADLDCGKSRFVEYDIVPFNNFFIIFQNDARDEYFGMYKVALSNTAFTDCGKLGCLRNVIHLNNELYAFTRECTYKSTDGIVWNVCHGIRTTGQFSSSSSIYKTKYNVYCTEPYERYSSVSGEALRHPRYMVTGKDLMNWRYISPNDIYFDQMEFKGKIYIKGASKIRYSLMNYFYLPVISNGYIKVVD